VNYSVSCRVVASVFWLGRRTCDSIGQMGAVAVCMQRLSSWRSTGTSVQVNHGS